MTQVTDFWASVSPTVQEDNIMSLLGGESVASGTARGRGLALPGPENRPQPVPMAPPSHLSLQGPSL